MNLGEVVKRMHDPQDFLAILFAQEKAKFNYTHEYFLDDSMYREFVDFREALEKITVPEAKSHVFKYQKEMKDFTLHFRKLKFEEEEKVVRENMEREARQQVVVASTSTSQS